MDHLVIPLDEPHARVLGELAGQLLAGAELDAAGLLPTPHLTLLAFRGLDWAAAEAALAPLAAATAPFTVHAHGYGFFAAAEPAGLSLHVPVVRGARLDRLHRQACAALRCAGAEVAGWTDPEVWTPHLTVLDRGLDAERLGRAVAWLARRHHPSWRIPVDRLELTGGWPQREHPGLVLPLGA